MKSIYAGASYSPISCQVNCQNKFYFLFLAIKFVCYYPYLLPLELPSQTSYPALAKIKAGALSGLCMIQESAESARPCYKKTVLLDFYL